MRRDNGHSRNDTRTHDAIVRDGAQELLQVADGRKPWWKARRGIGLAVLLLVAFYNAVAVPMLGWPRVEIVADGVTVIVDQALQAVGFALLAVGAWKAKQPLSLRKSPRRKDA